MFITFEGTEGSGKSWQVRALVERLRARDLSVLQTHEPGGTPLGDQVRQLVLLREDLNLSPHTEALLMNASRSQLVMQVICPALERGEVVVCDRFADSTRAYQGAGRGLDVQALNSVISFATADLEPDMTMLLDLPVEEPESTSPLPHAIEPDERSRIVALLGPTPVVLDDLVRLSGSSPAIVRTVLLELEIAGRLERHGGGLVSLISVRNICQRACRRSVPRA